MTNNNSSKPTLKQRRAQSQRDKARNRQQNLPSRSSAMSTARNNISLVNMPSATDVRIRQSFRVLQGPSKYPGSMKIQGTELLTSLNQGNGIVGQILLDQPLSPFDLVGSRLFQFGDLFEKYLFQRVTYHFVPNSGISAGSIVLYYDKDPRDVLSSMSGTAAVRLASSGMDSQPTPRWVPINLNTRLASPDEGYFIQSTGQSISDQRLTTQGRFYVINADGFNGAVGSIWISYDCDLFYPSLYESSTEDLVQFYLDRDQLSYLNYNVPFINDIRSHDPDAIAVTGQNNTNIRLDPSGSILVPKGSCVEFDVNSRKSLTSTSAPNNAPPFPWVDFAIGNIIQPVMKNIVGIDVFNVLKAAGNLIEVLYDSTDMTEVTGWFYTGNGLTPPKPESWETVRYLLKAPYDLFLDIKSIYQDLYLNTSQFQFENEATPIDASSSSLVLDFHDISESDFIDGYSKAMARNQEIMKNRTLRAESLRVKHKNWDLSENSNSNSVSRHGGPSEGFGYMSPSIRRVQSNDLTLSPGISKKS